MPVLEPRRAAGRHTECDGEALGGACGRRSFRSGLFEWERQTVHADYSARNVNYATLHQRVSTDDIRSTAATVSPEFPNGVADRVQRRYRGTRQDTGADRRVVRPDLQIRKRRSPTHRRRNADFAAERAVYRRNEGAFARRPAARVPGGLSQPSLLPDIRERYRASPPRGVPRMSRRPDERRLQRDPHGPVVRRNHALHIDVERDPPRVRWNWSDQRPGCDRTNWPVARTRFAATSAGSGRRRRGG
jgi:hypothetical protein